MIDFKGIEKRKITYEIGYCWVWHLLNLVYYRKLEIKGLENLPDEPYLIVSNHQNGLCDALLPVFGVWRHRAVFIARGDIFKKDIVARLLKWCRILPAFRVRDTGKENIGENDKIFNLAADILVNGKIVGLFPEAALQYNRAIGSFKKGFARIAFLAEEKSDFNLHLKIVPVANYYTNFFSIGHEALLNIGEPFEFGELFDLYNEHPEAALRQLALKAQERVRPLMLDIDDKENFEGLDGLRELYCNAKKPKINHKHVSERLALDQEMLGHFRKMKEDDPERFGAIMEKSLAYAGMLKKLNFKNWIIGKKYNLFNIVLMTLVSLFCAPFYAIFWLINIVPYKIPDIIVNKMKDKRLSASIRIGFGTLITFPSWYILLFGLSFLIPWAWWCPFIIAAPFFPFTLKGFVEMRHWYVKYYHRCRYYGMQARNSELKMAVETKQSIITELKTL